MIKVLTAISILVLLPLSSAYCDYFRLKDEFSSYEPPKSFLVPGTAKQDTRDTAQAIQSIQSEDLSFLKASYGERLANIGRERVDGNTYQTISKLAGNDDALIEKIRQRIRLKEIKVIALLKNPALEAARKRVLAELQSFDQVSNLDDTLRQYTSFTRAINTKAGPLKGQNSIKMAFPPPGLTALKGRIVESQVSVLMEKAAVTGNNVLRDIEAVFWDLVFVEKSIRITHETIAAFERLKDVATVLYRSGKTSFQDVIKINIKLEELKEDLVTLASRKETVTIRMFEVLNLPATKPGNTETVSLPGRIPAISQLYTIAREHRPELNAVRFQIDKVSSMVEMSESMIEARSNLGFSLYEADHINTTGTDAPKDAFPGTTMASMKNNSPNQAWYGISEPWLQQTRQTLESLENTLKSRENATDRMVKNGWFKADKDKREHALYKSRILPLAKSALDVSTREYEAGSIPFSQAIDSYTYWLKVKLTIAKKKADYGTSFAELENITGKQLR